MSLFSNFEHWFLTRFARKAVRLLLHDLFREIELTNLTNEMILAELKKDSFVRISGAVHEVAFWDRRLHKGIPERAGKTQLAGRDLNYFQELTQHFPADQISILDVGAGPFTTIGTYFGDLRLNITAVDPLAQYYEDLLHKYALDPPVKIIFAEAEKLSAQFAPESFHWVNAKNSIDHAAQPVHAIREMIPLVKPGGMMTLSHRSNEAVNESYSGFHQWNLYQENGIFYVCGRERSDAVNINEMIPSDWNIRAYDEQAFVIFEARRSL
jgi:2-polyprenyl-3-methyl-5-hydroxy-6-metoxy-1,4-benzoquinol methylase